VNSLHARELTTSVFPDAGDPGPFRPTYQGLASYQTTPTAERGGRARRCYRATRPALAALRASRRALVRLWDGLEALD